VSRSSFSEEYGFSFINIDFRVLNTLLVHYWSLYWVSDRDYFLQDKLTGLNLVKKFPVSFKIRRFISMITTACHLSVSWARWIQSTPLYTISLRYTPSNPVSLRSTLILSSNLSPDLRKDHFPLGSPTKTLLSLSTRATCLPISSTLVLSSWKHLVGNRHHEAASCYFLSLRSKYFPQHPVLFFFQCDRPKFTPVPTLTQVLFLNL
jgi:hypothetical protein